MHLSGRFDAALAAAALLHNGQLRKDTDIPYISHLLAVAAIVLEHGGSEDEAIAALLHDAVEDQGGQRTLDRIALSFGDEVADIVASVSDSLADTATEAKPPWCERKSEYIARIRDERRSVLLVSCADKLHNVRSILAEFDALEESCWSKFSGGRAGTLWYYRSLADAFLAAGDSPLAKTFNDAVCALEHHAKVTERTKSCSEPDS